ncbi:MAG: hypothetical protein PPP56_13360 [Longimonas sp.]|uniref:hypothetical protein n=1 Tax=Longimonas sp. TaxID=2039626 RepID=UPI0033531AA0
MKYPPLLSRLAVITLLPALLILGGCDALGIGGDDHADLGELDVVAPDGTVAATWTIDGGWNVDSLPAIPADENVTWDVNLVDRDGEALSADDGFTARYDVENPDQNILHFEGRDVDSVNGVTLFHGSAVTFSAQNAGSVDVQFLLWHDGHADDATDFITLPVEPPSNDES